MNEKIKLLKNEIDSFLTKHKKFSSFKIGKTGNLDYRRKEYYELGFQFVWEIATGEAQIITNTEKGLIKMKNYYNGLNEIINVEYYVELDEQITYQIIDLEGKLAYTRAYFKEELL